MHKRNRRRHPNGIKLLPSPATLAVAPDDSPSPVGPPGTDPLQAMTEERSRRAAVPEPDRLHALTAELAFRGARCLTSYATAYRTTLVRTWSPLRAHLAGLREAMGEAL